eukprot:362836-Chlamydomonas_euryale.AAC.13
MDVHLLGRQLAGPSGSISAYRGIPGWLRLPGATNAPRGLAVVDAARALEHLHYSASAIHLEHLPSPNSAVAELDLHDLAELWLLLAQSNTCSIAGSNCQAFAVSDASRAGPSRTLAS